VSFVFGWGLLGPIIESHQNKKWVWPWARGAPQNIGTLSAPGLNFIMITVAVKCCRIRRMFTTPFWHEILRFCPFCVNGKLVIWIIC